MTKAMTYVAVLTGWMLLISVGACGRDKATPKKAAHGHGHDADTISVQRFGKRTEIFVEYPPLVAGKPVTFTAHFTVLGKRF